MVDRRLRLSLFLMIGLAAALAAALPAQGKLFHPEKFERATATDASGHVGWAPHQGPKCPNCGGAGKHKCTTCERYPDEATKCPDCARKESRESVCHACAGTGTFPDPLQRAICPGCMGGGHIVCGFCPGSGILRLGDDKRWSNCPGCRGEGFFTCPVCKGERLVEVASLKPSLADADAAALQRAIAQTNELIEELGAFTPTAKNSRKEQKDLQKIFKDGEKLYGPFKRMGKAVDELMKRTYPGAQFQGQGEREANALARMKSGAEFYLKHQRRILQLALQRAEANAKSGDR